MKLKASLLGLLLGATLLMHAESNEKKPVFVKNGNFTDLIQANQKKIKKGKIIGDYFPQNWGMYGGTLEVMKKSDDKHAIKVADTTLYQGLYKMAIKPDPRALSVNINASGTGSLSIRYKPATWGKGKTLQYTGKNHKSDVHTLTEKSKKYTFPVKLNAKEIFTLYITIKGEAIIDDISVIDKKE